MAGSFRHVTDNDGAFRGIDLIDNLGDAHQALEECYEMIQYLTHGDQLAIYTAWLEGYFKKHCPPENLPEQSCESFWRD